MTDTPAAFDELATVFERLGGIEPFQRISEVFYDRIDTDPGLRDMFPDDLTDARQNQWEFLVQYFGGPPLYSERKGHPRLRARHMPFPIDRDARDRWVGHMRVALIEADIPESERNEMMAYFEHVATFLMNRP